MPLTNEDNVRRLYERHPHFNMLTNVIIEELRSGALTTEQVAQAAALGAQMYAEQYGAPVMIKIVANEN